LHAGFHFSVSFHRSVKQAKKVKLSEQAETVHPATHQPKGMTLAGSSPYEQSKTSSRTWGRPRSRSDDGRSPNAAMPEIKPRRSSHTTAERILPPPTAAHAPPITQVWFSIKKAREALPEGEQECEQIRTKTAVFEGSREKTGARKPQKTRGKRKW
jgi:hypothetical protein